MTTDFRALSAELFAEINSLIRQSWLGEIHANDDLINRAIDALAEPLSLKEQALEILEINNDVDSQLSAFHYYTIRRALEALPND